MAITRTPGDYLRTFRPERPVIGFRPAALARAAEFFVSRFAGRVLYAVKANDADHILAGLWAAGIEDFDVASLDELATLRRALPDARAHIMHPVKSRALIRAAYAAGCRTFALDSHDELAKIVAETDGAADLTLAVRMAVSNTFSELPLDGKFGVSWADAPALLQAARQAADSLAVTFHVGSQAMTPVAFSAAMRQVSSQIVQAGVVVDVLDVGGGFPSIYPGMEPPPLGDFLTEIAASFERMNVTQGCELWCEPGRALVAEAESVLVRVEARVGNTLHINDGAFGTLFDAAHCKFVYPARGVGREGEALADFDLFGPTCDAMDHMAGPFRLPAGIAEGDWIEIGMLGAYGRVMAGRFNGFGQHDAAVFDDAPFASSYDAVSAAAATGA